MEKVNLNKVQDISAGLTTLVSFIKHNYKPLFKVFTYYLAVPILIVSLLMAMGMGNYFTFINDLSTLEPGSFPEGVDIDNPFSLISYMFPASFFFGLILAIILNILFTAVIYRYIHLYNTSSDGVVNIKDIQDNLGGIFLKFTWFFIVSFFMLLLGFMMCIIPGIYLSVIISPLFIVALEENLNIGDSIRRCFDLIQDKWWQTAAFLLLVSLIIGFASSIIQLPISLLSAFAPLMGLENIGFIMGLSLVVSMIFGYIVNIFIYIATAIWYYNLREQKDGTSLMQSIDQIGKNEENNEDSGDNFDYFR